MTLGDLIVGAVVLAAAILAARSIYKARKSGAVCGGSCGSCQGCDHCH